MKTAGVVKESLFCRKFAPSRLRVSRKGLPEEKIMAWDLGRGVYLNRNGHVPPFQVITRHLSKVLTICRQMELHPMMWSDMFFRVLSKR